MAFVRWEAGQMSKICEALDIPPETCPSVRNLSFGALAAALLDLVGSSGSTAAAAAAAAQHTGAKAAACTAARNPAARFRMTLPRSRQPDGHRRRRLLDSLNSWLGAALDESSWGYPVAGTTSAPTVASSVLANDAGIQEQLAARLGGNSVRSRMAGAAGNNRVLGGVFFNQA
eukprot:313619-Chlamydomonas_euryale.AAC.2